MRKTHTKIIKNWKFCEFCNFNSITEKEMEERILELKFTQRNSFTQATIQETKDEIFKMKENGNILYTDVKACEEILSEFLKEQRRDLS
jgi:uncharacterized protein VirK/YbjX